MRYYKFSDYLKKRFGCRVSKISIDAGFSCPNRDGKISRDGCLYCDNRGFSLNTRLPAQNIETQIENGIKFSKKRFKAEKYIIYFQAYSNTYASPDVLKKKYDVARKYDDIVSIAIGTRPDCIDSEILGLLEGYAADYEVWLEFGLQSMHDKTLASINRGHTYEDFLKAVAMTRGRHNIKICSHVIIGLPEETESEIYETAAALGQLKIDAVKIHPLHVMKGTKLEEMYEKKLYTPLEMDRYIKLLIGFLEHLWPKTIIQRVTADCPKEFLVAPDWISEKNKVQLKIDKMLAEKDTFQGRLYKLT